MFTDNLCKEWDDEYQKNSHEGKSLAKHVKEIKDMLKYFLTFYETIPQKYLKASEYLAEYHDRGKLCKEWNLYKKKLPPHSPWSVQWIIENKKIFEPDKDLTFILSYFIMKHHSKLTDIPPFQEHIPLIHKVNCQIKKMHFEDKINLVDTFGLFKVADVLSASNQLFIPKKPLIRNETVKKILGTKIDGQRWSQQLQLKEIGYPGLLRAYTGWGKTTASLLFFTNKKVKKVFYLLPTTTAINRFYEKLSSVFSNDVSKYFYFCDTELTEKDDILSELFFAKNFLTPIVITTIDQFLLSFLQYGKYHTKRVMFREAGLIFDEVHLLNPLMLSLTTYFLKKYARLYRLKALFMSATLPDSLTRYFIEELDIPKKHFLDFSNEYRNRRRVMLAYNSTPIEKGIARITKLVEEGKRVLVILNTVRKAVELARLIEEHMSRDKIILLHSRFMYKDRKEKEADIEKKRQVPHVLISTQITEVSLDISYDVLFTEISALPSIIQRFGRINRKNEFGKRINHINAHLFEPTITNEFYYPYAPNEIELARKVVKEVEGTKLGSEHQLLDILNSEYSYDDLMSEIQEADKRFHFRAFEKLLGFFFSLKIKEEKLMDMLSYRSAFTLLTIPHPKCIQDNDLKKHVETLITQPMKQLNFKRKQQLIARIKDISIPVPMWWLKKDCEVYGNVIFPLAAFKNRIYDRYYGLVESDVL